MEQVWSYLKFIDIGRKEIYFSEQYNKLEKFRYVYDYQLIKKGQAIEEKRTLLEANKKGVKPRFQADKPVFGPIGLLGKYWQQYHHYRILKEDDLNGIKTLVIEVKPVEHIKTNPNYGKVWIGLQDFDIIKIDYYQESLVNFTFYKNEASYFGAMPDLVITTTFGIERNGIRFPSQTVFEENYIGGDLKSKLRRSKMIINYEDYKFFTVEVEVNIKY